MKSVLIKEFKPGTEGNSHYYILQKITLYDAFKNWLLSDD